MPFAVTSSYTANVGYRRVVLYDNIYKYRIVKSYNSSIHSSRTWFTIRDLGPLLYARPGERELIISSVQVPIHGLHERDSRIQVALRDRYFDQLYTDEAEAAEPRRVDLQAV